MDLFDAINQRRSIRKFDGQAVPREVLERIVAAGVEAPSGCNAQLRHYVIVDDPAVMEKLRPVSKAMTGAAACIVIVMEPKPTPYGEYWVQDASAAMQNMLLAAVALGYGACWIEGHVRRCEPAVREALGLPGHLRPWSLLPIGRAAENPSRPPKPSPADLTHYNRW